MKRLVLAAAVALAVSSAQGASLVETYKDLVSTAASGSNSVLSPEQQKLLEDPAQLLASLEKQFYDKPSIESLAWYGSVAEDLAYISMSRRATSPVSTAWVKPARATWRKMLAHMEHGWAAGSPWPRFGELHFESFVPTALADSLPWPDQAFASVLVQWFPRAVPSFFQRDTDAYFAGGEPLTKRQMLRGGAAGQVFYVAEISHLGMSDEASRPTSLAGGFRSAHSWLEFLKGQGDAPAIKFVNASQYGIDGLLGTIGVDVNAPPSVPVMAITREGGVSASGMRVTSRHINCGTTEGVRVSFSAPLKSSPLAYFATLKPVTTSKVRVKRVGEFDSRDPHAAPDSRPFHYTGYRVDLDGDGQTDLVIIQGQGPADLPTGGYHPEDSLQSIVYANIGGVWKRVALAAEGGCT
ncbi:hypothetical protein [Piscinibacter terrae]|uniref:VCBS repeat-containing protein n=1 Tax=Piscinibacter terrae TaxID=2496871 RepID=A0A3N7JPG1_9BURK|nr:hypothetical protein [Albitalea terrae]RQP22959.1 hypothetical protein DZC73_17670 [Albitalea terrae]